MSSTSYRKSYKDAFIGPNRIHIVNYQSPWTHWLVNAIQLSCLWLLCLFGFTTVSRMIYRCWWAAGLFHSQRTLQNRFPHKSTREGTLVSVILFLSYSLHRWHDLTESITTKSSLESHDFRNLQGPPVSLRTLLCTFVHLWKDTPAFLWRAFFSRWLVAGQSKEALSAEILRVTALIPTIVTRDAGSATQRFAFSSSSPVGRTSLFPY
jgi:hypothetical protein